ncbi:MAG: hypothetical protein A2075_13940 [Geobacteraceae bacterium GWC2_58_44]|nr:MAG: hypothetical protein A2075_13940 [Geobacteraceae bacterium GWC2_58_44]HBG08025.1 hypothetical protein [Geobacter sp.]
MIDEIIAEMGSLFRKGVFAERTSFCFYVGDITITIIIEADTYSVEKGTTVERPDCSCKTDTEMFRKIWHDGYKPGIFDFLSGEIKCDAPLKLPHFLEAFGK